MKKLGRLLVVKVLEWQVARLRQKHTFKVIAVAGSVGKTSTKSAIGTVLGATRRVRYQVGNYNDRVTVPLVFFGHDEPNIMNVLAWIKIALLNERAIRQNYPYDIVVLELGTDAPGQMADFAYTQPDIAVLTAIAPEHMENFHSLENVAAEEATVFDYSNKVLANVTSIDEQFLAGRDFVSYGLTDDAGDFRIANEQVLSGEMTQKITVTINDQPITATIAMLGKPGALAAGAAIAVAKLLDVGVDDSKQGLALLRPFSGRMQQLRGIHDSVIIDDTYNASPTAMIAALDFIYGIAAPRRIALLGNMNELGETSQTAHSTVGKYCDPKFLDMVVTLGPDANTWLAPVARSRGCEVRTCTSPYEAGEFIKSILIEQTVVLCKGSQNGVFAEEAAKLLLADPADASRLVRQSSYWMARKAKQFPRPHG